MEYIAHRINTSKELKCISTDFGVEIDIRGWGEKLILQHDPFIVGEELNEYFKNYNHGTLILNVKCERLEIKILELLKKYKIKKYFFLDSTIPMINALTKHHKISKIAVRFSELESFENLKKFSGKVEWVWVDCFDNFILTKKLQEEIHGLGYKICIVSPELQGRQDDINIYRDYIYSNNIEIDAICTKVYNIPLWKNEK